MGEAAIARSARPATVAQDAHDAIQAQTEFAGEPGRDAALRSYLTRFQQSYGQRLTVDGTYGRNTRQALADITDIAISELPAIPAHAAPSPRTPAAPAAPSAVPAKLSPALVLSTWTEQAVAADTTAARVLRALNQNASVRALRTRGASLSGPLTIDRTPEATVITHRTVGELPDADAPDSSTAQARAQSVWDRARAAGASVSRAVERQAEAAYAAGLATLTAIRRRLDGEVDQATREALTALERTLTAILRPAARAVSLATARLSGPLVLLGVGLLALYLVKR